MHLDLEFLALLVAILGQALFVAFKLGKMEEKLNTLEKKQEKHNNLIERMTRCEDSTRSAHKRLDDIMGK